MTLEQTKNYSIFNAAVVVAALGYFVDIYDLLLFSMVRINSINGLGVFTLDEARNIGEAIISWQMAGLLVGGILWGTLGDKKGRLSVLFGSILLYSICNILNGFIGQFNIPFINETAIDQYKWVRFIAGIGLAGELGAGITLVAEITPKEKRGIATSLVAGIGLSGAVLAYVMKENFAWRICYFIGGGLGFLLLVLRISVSESGMFNAVKTSHVAKGNFFMLFTNKERLTRYLLSILIGLPTWYVIGVLLTFSNDFAAAFNVQGNIDPSFSVMVAYIAISIADILIGLLSLALKSRKKALYIFYGITLASIIWYFTGLYGASTNTFYICCACLGFGTGFWALFVTIGAEQFGTNLRATAATTIPNMVRGLLAFMILPLYKFFRSETMFNNIITGAIVTGIIIMVIACTAVYFIKETYGKDLDFIEE